jgi:putative DNA primase/helicase
LDPETIVEEALGQVESGKGPLILSTGSPLVSAREMIRRRYMQPGAQTIHHQQSTFFVWSGSHYREIDREEVRADVYRFLDGAQQLNKEGKQVPFNPTRNKVGDVFEALAAAAQLPGTVRAPTWLCDDDRPNADEFLACANGLLHLPTRALLPHTPAFFGVNAVDYAYDATANPPEAWLNFLNSIWPDEQEPIDSLQELFGLLLTPDTRHQKAFLIIGPKRSGKGTIARVITALLGADNVVGPTLNNLSQNFGLSPLIGKPLAIISDARLGGRTDEHVIAERILSITGEDSLSVDRKFLPAWTGRLPTRFLILTNELPKLSDASGALASRFIVWRLTRSFYEQEDMNLTAKLLVERPSILLWAMEGLDRLVRRGHFIQPKSGDQAVRDLGELASPISAFVRDCCVLNPKYSEECGKLFEAWIAWCRDNGVEDPGTTQIFGRDLKAAFCEVETDQIRVSGTEKRLRFYKGIALQ